MEQIGQSEESPIDSKQYSDCSMDVQFDVVGLFGIFDVRVETFKDGLKSCCYYYVVGTLSNLNSSSFCALPTTPLL